MVRAAVIPAALVGVAALALGALSSTAAMAGAVVGAVLAGVACAVPGVLLIWTRRWSPPAVMALALAGYLVLVVILGALYVGLSGASWLSGPHLGWTLMASAAAAVAGQMRAVARLRIPAFGSSGEG